MRYIQLMQPTHFVVFQLANFFLFFFSGKYLIWLFFKIDLCSAISFKRSRRELSINVAEHRSILKNNQNTHYPRFSFTPKRGTKLPETGVLFLLCRRRKHTFREYSIDVRWLGRNR